MIDFEYWNHPAVYTLFRLILGILFLMQGYEKVFRIGLRGVVDAYELPQQWHHTSNYLVWAGTIYTSWTELVCGALLIVGLFTNYALYFLGIDIVMATLGLSFQFPLLDMKFLWPRLVLLGVLLFCPANWNLFSVDHLLNIK
jgi:uncharacterized membrane protein YphA (DoxX/SURF4 family)